MLFIDDMKSALAVGCILGLMVGCGGSTGDTRGVGHGDDQPPAAPPNAGNPPAPLDHGAPSDKYPAFTPDVPQLRNNGGHVLANPVVVTITWPGDANVDTFEHIGDTLGATQYWKDVVGEYGVGPLASGAPNHVRLTDANKPTIDPKADPIEELANWLAKQLENPAANGFPAPTDQSIYAMYVGGQTAADICNMGAGGLHDSVVVGGKDVAFAIINQCEPPPGAPFDMMGESTISASHELAEASVDPWPSSTPGWAGVDDDHLAVELMVAGNDENADLCDMSDDSYSALPPEIPFMVERTWSNKSAAAGHSPCVPAPAGAYFSVTPTTAQATIKADYSVFDSFGPPPFPATSKGFPIAVGETKQIGLGIWSDAPTGDIQIDAFEVDPFDLNPKDDGSPSNPTLDVSLDKKSGKNGEKTYVSVKVNKSNAIGVQLVLVALTVDQKTVRYFPIVVGGNAADPAAKAALQKAIDSGNFRRLNKVAPKWRS